MQDAYTAAANESITVTRLDLFPLGTGLPAEAFDYELIVPLGTEGGYNRLETTDALRVIRFSIPGYYQDRMQKKRSV